MLTMVAIFALLLTQLGNFAPTNTPAIAANIHKATGNIKTGQLYTMVIEDYSLLTADVTGGVAPYVLKVGQYGSQSRVAFIGYDNSTQQRNDVCRLASMELTSV